MTILKKYLLFLVLIFSAFITNAQQNIKNITVENGLPSNTIFDIQQDKTGYLLIATNKGLVKFDGDDFTQINKLKTNVIGLKEDVIYTGTENGLFIKNKSKEQFLPSKKILKIFFQNEELFLGTEEGIYHLKNNILVSVKINATVDFSIINDIIFHNNSFYIASNKGLWQIDNLQNPRNIFRISTKNIVSLLTFQENVIAATLNNGLLIINDNLIEKEIATLENISSIKKLKNEIWVTSKTNGLEVFVLPSFSFKQKINKYNSLTTNTIYDVFKDRQNSIFIASDQGIFSIKNDVENQSFFKPTIYFENLQVNHQDVDSLLTAKKVNFSNSENNISITFKTVHISNPKKVNYRYTLNNEFSPWSVNNTIQFPNLNAGNYNFQVQSKIDNDESDIIRFAFRIDAPFYKKAWFIFAVVISFLIIGYFYLDFYLKNITKKHKEKLDSLKLKNRLLSLEQKALQLQMNPHFIFNVLNGIKALGNTNKVDELNATISKFSVLLRGILNNSRTEEITLQEEITLLKNYIELEQRMSSKTFTFTITSNLNNIDPDEILIPTMLLQPFVENCVQHAFQKNDLGTIQINFDVKHSFLECVIIDNGIGIHQSKKRKTVTDYKSVALNVTKERLHIVSNKSNFKIDEIIEDTKVKGTKVSFRIPLKTDY
ncbi:histidine kinase [Polaribacter sp. Hel_I_88]|uniref:sensor histidine kinase n=1 Tax=Polaribacter sp. Hel_I_88 TaxID=1250006 RepID=UPI00047B96E4|nr:histidine kinase [Polaribacter sp. Hel_I_88]